MNLLCFVLFLVHLLFVLVEEVETPEFVVDALFTDAQLTCRHRLVAPFRFECIDQSLFFQLLERLSSQ